MQNSPVHGDWDKSVARVNALIESAKLSADSSALAPARFPSHTPCRSYSRVAPRKAASNGFHPPPVLPFFQ